jgi:hypothetical protein
MGVFMKNMGKCMKEILHDLGCMNIMNSVVKVDKSALKLLILGWVVVYDKYKTTLVSAPRHRIALVDFLRPESMVSGFQGRRQSTCAIR